MATAKASNKRQETRKQALIEIATMFVDQIDAARAAGVGYSAIVEAKLDEMRGAAFGFVVAAHRDIEMKGTNKKPLRACPKNTNYNERVNYGR